MFSGHFLLELYSERYFFYSDKVPLIQLISHPSHCRKNITSPETNLFAAEPIVAVTVKKCLEKALNDILPGVPFVVVPEIRDSWGR